MVSSWPADHDQLDQCHDRAVKHQRHAVLATAAWVQLFG
jgi:hypothetical protein